MSGPGGRPRRRAVAAAAATAATAIAAATATGSLPGAAQRLAGPTAAFVAIAMTVATPAPSRAAPGAGEQHRIDALLDAVAADRHSRFVRSGVEYSGADAARFLRAKLQAQGASVQTAEDFIERIASRSSTTGRPYRVCRTEGACVDAGEHLRAMLPRVAGRP